MLEKRRLTPLFRHTHKPRYPIVILTGLILSIIFPIALETTDTAETQLRNNAGVPRPANISINDTLSSNQTFIYETYIQYTTNDPAEDPGNFKITTGHNITEISPYLLRVNEHIIVNNSNKYPAINGKTYAYDINSTSNLIWNATSGFPSIFTGGWQHNYPTESNGFTLNNNEISYAFSAARTMDLTYKSQETLTFKEVSISTQKFTGTKQFVVTCGAG